MLRSMLNLILTSSAAQLRSQLIVLDIGKFILLLKAAQLEKAASGVLLNLAQHLNFMMSIKNLC